MHTELPANGARLIDRIRSESGLTHSQIQIWTAQKVHPDNPFCNMAFIFRIAGTLDEAAFAQAWQLAVDASDALRTSIDEIECIPRIRLLDPGACGLRRLDFSDCNDPDKAFRDWSNARCKQPLPLDGELVESALCKLGPERFGWYLNQHHIVTDASSTVLLFKEVARSYARLLQRSVPAAPAIPSYYATSSALKLTRPDGASRSASDKSRTVRLFGRSPQSSVTASRRIETRLTEDESAAIRRLCDEPELQSFFPDISLFTFFATILAALLHRFSGQTNIGIDAPAANRASPQAKASLGCFIEMFPLDLSVEAGDTFRSLAERCMADARRFLAAAAPGASSPVGSSSSNAVLNFFPKAFGPFADLAVTADWIHSGHIDGVYDLKLQAHDYNGTGAFTIQLDLSESAFSAEQMELAPQRVRSLLQAAIANFDAPIAACAIVTNSERTQLLDGFNRDRGQPFPDRTVTQLIEEQVALHPDRMALRQGSRALSYRELWQRVEANARHLRSVEIAQESCVAIPMRRSADAVIAILSVLRAGAAFIPIDPNYPPQRIADLLATAQPKLALVDSPLANRIAASGIPTLRYDELGQSEQSPGIALPTTGLSDLAYVIYTSGSTGTPKGVEIEHRGLSDYLEWAAREYVRGDVLRFPLSTSLAFDLTITSLFLPFITGGELIVYEQSASEVDAALIDAISDNMVEFVKLTPSHLTLLRQLDLSHSRIRRIVVGGEDLKAGLADAIVRQLPRPPEIYNEYGPTECVVGCMIHRFSDEDSINGGSVPIGKPADHVRLYVVNEALQPVPEGVPGELLISRHGIARGYRLNPERTRHSFIESPFKSGERLYRTGDLVRFSAPGVLTFLGRIDAQVKISGHRVELGEIESALLAHGAIRAAHVIVQSSPALPPPSANATAHCRTCGLASNYPNIVFDEGGICGICNAFESIKEEANAYFESKESLVALFEHSRAQSDSKYDCMVFYSGGKDSTYALCKLVDLGLRVYAFTLDNGYISPQALENIRRVVVALGVDHEFASTPAMNEIFKDSLTRFSNVCNGCFKTIYTLGINRAHELRIPIIVTGLSRGQFFETRLTENLFRNGRFSPSDVDRAVLEARKAYHRVEDAVSRCLDTSLLRKGEVLEEIIFIDFFRYWEADLDELYAYLAQRVPWMRPSDTGRSTNCRVNDVGIYIHKKERGFHNYALPYSWDVRMGHKRREEALMELDDQIDVAEVRRMLQSIGYDEDRVAKADDRNRLIAYYVADRPLPAHEVESAVARVLPTQIRPSHYVQIERMPLTPNGKIDAAALPPLDPNRALANESHVDPQGPVQEHVLALWIQSLKTDRISANDSFFQRGGTSLDAMEVTLRVCRDFGIDLPLQTIFQHPTIAEFSAAIETLILRDIDALSDEEALLLASENPPQ